MRRQSAPQSLDLAIADLAARQGGVVAHGQLCALGISASAVARRVRAGRLHARHRGVYTVGHRLVGAVGARWAAVLACAPRSFVSHASACAAFDLRRSDATLIDITIAGRGGRRAQPGIRIHRSGTLAADEVTTLAGLPITTPARSLLDLAATGVAERALERALDAAEQRGLLDFAALGVLLDRHIGRRGTPALRAVLEDYAPGAVDTRSALEDLIRDLCKTHEMPRPQINVVVAGRVRDFFWPHARLVVEGDSYRWHRSPSALVEDRERDVELTLAGYRTLRFTWRDVTRRPAYVERAIRRALGAL